MNTPPPKLEIFRSETWLGVDGKRRKTGDRQFCVCPSIDHLRANLSESLKDMRLPDGMSILIITRNETH